MAGDSLVFKKMDSGGQKIPYRPLLRKNFWKASGKNAVVEKEGIQYNKDHKLELTRGKL